MKKIIEEPQTLPLSLDETKEQLRLELDYTREDDKLTLLIGSATDFIENHCDRAIITQRWSNFFESWDELKESVLTPGRLQSVENVYYTDSDGNRQNLPDTQYIVEGVGTDAGKIIFDESADLSGDLYSSYPVAVEFTCGYGDNLAVPDGLKQIMLIHITYYWQNRETGGIEEKLYGLLDAFKTRFVI